MGKIERILLVLWPAFVMAGVLHSTVSGIGMGSPNYRTVDAGPVGTGGGCADDPGAARRDTTEGVSTCA